MIIYIYIILYIYILYIYILYILYIYYIYIMMLKHPQYPQSQSRIFHDFPKLWHAPFGSSQRVGSYACEAPRLADFR